MKRKQALAAAVFVLLLLSGCGGKGKTITSPEDLNASSMKIGAATGSVSESSVREEFPLAEILCYDSVADGCAAVSAGKLDAFAFDRENLGYYAQHNPETVVMEDGLDAAVQISAAMRLEDTELCARVNGILAQLERDGILADMRRRWFETGAGGMPELEPPEAPQGTLRILTEGMSAPLNYVGGSGEVIGYDIEFGLRLAYAMNMDASIETLPFGALVASLTSGKGDIILSAMNATAARAQNLLFSDPYLTTQVGLLVPADRYVKPSTKITLTGDEVAESLQTAKVGAMTGSRGAFFIEENYPSAELLQFEGTGDAVAALKSGKLDYVICGMATASNYARANSDVVYVDYPLTGEGLAVAVAKGNTQLRDKISACIEAYRESGLLAEMKQRWYEPVGDSYKTVDIPVHEDGEVLRVAVTGTQEPVCFLYNNELTGHDCELMKRIAWDLGMRIEFQDMPISGKVAALQSGKVDASPSLVPTEERVKAVDFTSIYFDNPQTLLTLAPSAAGAKRSFAESLSDFWGSLGEKFTATFLTEQRWKLVVSGLLLTLEISILSFALATVWGGALLWMERSRWRLLRGFAAVFARVVAGTPILVVLMLLYYVVFRGVNISSVLVAILGFGLYYGAGLAGVFRTGVDSVDKGEREAAAALGFRPREVFRKIVLPQAVSRVFGLYQGQFVALVKATSIVGYIAIQDLTKAGDLIRSRTYDAFFPLLSTAVIYFLLIWALTGLLSLAEVRLDPKKRPRTLKGVTLR